MGRVWRAADEILDRQVAVKEMRLDGVDAEDSGTRRERTLREARATARIDHPNVVRVYDVVDEGERLWIVMELVAGRSLERIIAQDGPLSPRDAARIGLGLVAALRQVHARGVLHRDIKPGNVLVEETGRSTGASRVVLTDFGIAAIQDAKALTMVGMLVGSPDYMAPERVSGRPQGPPSDLWSLGATLCAALSGASPFSRETTLATLHAVLYEEPELPAAAGPLRDIIAAVLRKEPSARPTLEILEATLRHVAAPSPTLPVPPPEPSSTGSRPGGAKQDPPDASHAGAPVADPCAAPDGPAGTPQPEGTVRPAPPPPVPHLGAAGQATGRAAGGAPGRGARPSQPPARSSAADAETVGAGGDPHPHASARSPRPRRTPTARTAQPTPSASPPAPPRRRRTLFAALAGTALTAAATAAVLFAMSMSPGGTGRADGPSPSQTLSPTVEGTSRPATLPPGARREAGGFAWAPPDGWRRDVQTGAEVHYTSPDGRQELVAKSSLARGDLLKTWQTSERNAHQGQNYQKVRLEETTFRGHPAVVWEYTFTLKGTPWHARLLGFNQDGTSYQVNTWYQPGIEAEALTTYEKVKKSFTVM